MVDLRAAVAHVSRIKHLKTATLTFLLLTSLYFILSTSSSASPRPIQPAADTLHSGNHDQLVSFWVNLESHLKAAKPECSKVKVDLSCSVDSLFRPKWIWPEWMISGACNIKDMTFRPGEHEKPRADHVKMSPGDIDKLKASHENMVAVSKQLAPQMPFDQDTSGLVMVGGGKYNFLTLLSLRMLRLAGSQLPVEVFLVSPDEYDEDFCVHQLSIYNAKCRLLSDVLSATSDADKISQYQYKIFAILFSSYENVFFVDADAFVAFDVDDVLTTEPYSSTGLVLWPDLWAETSSPIWFQVAGLPVPPVQRLASDSGSMLYSKSKHAASLLLATYYNYYGPDYYYPLLSQGAHGQGDKETYLHAALALGEDFYDKHPIWEIGRWITPKYIRRVGMGQHHPGDDYTLTNADIHRKGRKIRPFLLHINNPWKLLPQTAKNIFRWWGPTWLNGKQIRLFGTREDMLETFGYDVEDVMWQQYVQLACELNTGCDKAKAYYKSAIEGA